MSEIKNPIIPGYYPDPSICRVGEDYYLACSSFELYPGIPLFHSRDLMHWEQICNVMTMENDFHVDCTYGGNGIMAPTIRYNNGTFYIINCNCADKGTFIVTASDPRGPWSQPHYLSDIPDIDASLFFDTDGACYVIGIGNVWDNGFGVMERGIWLAPYDIEHFRMTGKPVTIFNSALRGGATPESPHLYHIGEYYYLLIAEGGTAFYHCAAIARSRELFGFYENDPANPVITHRMMGTHAKVQNVGHADMVDTPDGRWYAVMLASRTLDRYYKSLGRETFLCPVEFEYGWPLFSPDTGLMEETYPSTGLPEVVYEAEPARDDFDAEKFGLAWTCWGTPYENYYSLHDSCLSIRCISQSLVHPLEPVHPGEPRRMDRCSPFLAKRQREFCFTASCSMRFHPSGNEEAGLAIVQSLNHQCHFYRAVEEGRQVLKAELYVSDFTTFPFLPGFSATTSCIPLGTVPYEGDSVVLRIESTGLRYFLSCGPSEDALEPFVEADATLINNEKIGCMTGTMIGVYATGNGTSSEHQADFDWFELK